MKKTFCDGCENEIIVHTNTRFEILCHISDRAKFGGNVQMYNGQMHPVSGRHDGFDLCLICYNEVMGAAWEKFNSIKYRNLSGKLPE